jgi:hypothetical protein
MWHTAERVHRADAEAFVDALQWQRATAGWSGTRLGHRHRMVLLPAPKPFNDSFAPGGGVFPVTRSGSYSVPRSASTAPNHQSDHWRGPLGDHGLLHSGTAWGRVPVNPPPST